MKETAERGQGSVTSKARSVSPELPSATDGLFTVGIGVESSSVIVISPRLSGSGPALSGSVRATENFSFGSKRVSPITFTVIVLVVCPGV